MKAQLEGVPFDSLYRLLANTLGEEELPDLAGALVKAVAKAAQGLDAAVYLGSLRLPRPHDFRCPKALPGSEGQPGCGFKGMADTPELTLLSAHALVQDLIAAQLGQEDRLRLAATCTALRAASLGWFPEVQATLHIPDTAPAEALAAWLCRYQAATRVRLDCGSSPSWYAHSHGVLQPLAECPAFAGCIMGLAQDADKNSAITWEVAQLLAFRSLQELDLSQDDAELDGWLNDVARLQCLTRLSVSVGTLGGSGACLGKLPRLQHLDISDCGVDQAVDVLRTLPLLTSLSLKGYYDSPCWDHLGSLPRLRCLALRLDPIDRDERLVFQDP
ncbi:hypothetical protein ABPG75_010661 [Micractinium tetrahymenae]